jgi:hypothetical protein
MVNTKDAISRLQLAIRKNEEAIKNNNSVLNNLQACGNALNVLLAEFTQGNPQKRQSTYRSKRATLSEIKNLKRK